LRSTGCATRIAERQANIARTTASNEKLRDKLVDRRRRRRKLEKSMKNAVAVRANDANTNFQSYRRLIFGCMKLSCMALVIHY